MFAPRRLAFALIVVFLAAGGAAAQDADVKPPTGSKRFERHEFQSPTNGKLSYWLMTPESIDPDKKYPLVLALHGRGGNTTAAGVLAGDEMRKKYPCFVMAPAVSRKEVWAVPDDFNKLAGRQRLPAVLEALEQLKKNHPIDADRVYVTGQSMGGFGSFGAVAASPETFAAAIPVCGGWAPAEAEKMKGVALWAFHGDADGTVPVERSRSMVEAIRKAGGTPKLTEYPGVGHNSWSRTYAAPETWEWLFAQRRAGK